MDFLIVLYLALPFGLFFCWESVGCKLVLLPLFLQILFRGLFLLPMLGTHFALKIHGISVLTLIIGAVVYAALYKQKRAKISTFCIILYIALLIAELVLIKHCFDNKC